MERDHFDQHISMKLESSTIAPSANAWSALEARLEGHDRPQKKSGKLYYWMAASIAVLLAANIYLIIQNKHTAAVPVVHTDKKPGETLPQQQHIVGSHTPVAQTETLEEDRRINTDKKPVRKAVAVVPEPETSGNAIAETGAEAQKVREAAAGVQNLYPEKTVTDAQIDALIAQAQAAIAAQRSQTTATPARTDAMALLEDVEDELDRNFKEKVFETLKESFFRVTTAVAERNH